MFAILLCTLLQFVFIVICVLKLLAVSYLCYKAYLPFHKIVVINKFVQSGAHSPSNTNGNAQSPQNGGTTALLRTTTTTPTKDARGSVQGSITTISVASTTGL
jgi:hypothetical protein